MYIPPYFKINDVKIMYDLIEKHSFATVISTHEDVPFASHLPLTLDRDQGVLYGHFARANPQWSDVLQQHVLAIFHGPHCYISPSWYETNKSVPTWNYVTVHVYGRIHFLNNDELLESLRNMVGKYEHAESPYKMVEAADYINGLAKGIVGFKLHISKMEGKAKLSQNHPEERQKRVIEQLEKLPDEDSRQIGALMKQNLLGS